MTGAEQLGGALLAVTWSILLWTRRDIKGVSKKLGREETKRRHLVTALLETTEEGAKRKVFTDYQMRED